MRPLLTPRWSQLRRPVTSATILSHRTRNFHATRSAAFIPEAIIVATGCLHSVHAVTGLPWVASIPLAAVAVRMCLTPFTLWTRILNRREKDIRPVVNCCTKHYQDAIRAKDMEERISMKQDDETKELQKALTKKINALYKEWKIPRWRFAINLVQMPVWLVFMEGMRNICGINMGLLQYLVPKSDENGVPSFELPGAEPSLATEGALWFPDLLAGDPTGLLPVMLGLTIFANVRLGFPTSTAAEASDQSRRQMYLNSGLIMTKQVLTFMGPWIAFSAWMSGMPAGIMLYWIVSTNTAMLQNKLLDKFLFVNKSLEPLPRMSVRLLQPGETPPPIKSMLK
ncbi:mitochondrial export translocase [Talaromyces pinophilus]|jgi:mitochondrial inner membrane protein COX18|uniref:Mitochondrial export translocase n=1 Tax=Talaromyces pinophilus TaxID=128442 RepID=A0A6V8HC09_TALPI|nr:Mitochondrial inner membrane protein COX18 [Talaromyces pinophilus]PCH05099.1 Membrane insertase OXA1/ALB3/YidC [Penicillium occitanis (nom. inval.)]PCH05586.1 hypothetical protein PENOC_028120 [Penicillium occitanis (nom. inval.)]GAM38987.1 mitochondrial export translocase [Talaromyces pinophilus]